MMMVSCEQDGTYLPPSPIPEEAIMRHLRVLEDCGGAGFGQRLGEVSEVVAGLLPTAEWYPGGKEVVAAALELLDAARR